MKNTMVIIPAYKPDEKLLTTLKELEESGFENLLVVNDGSGEEFTPIFENVKAFSNVTLLEHEVNRGKGAALKTAFAYINEKMPHIMVAVTADADGQHLTKDIRAVAKAATDSGSVVLGVRDFSDPMVPPRSKAGNKITRTVFQLLFGAKITDTQTGLRAFPIKYMTELIGIEGDRYEYETNMLIVLHRHKVPMEQVQITTVYIEENSSSHFRPVRDSIRVYAFVFKYLLSSVSAAVIDEFGFWLFKCMDVLAVLPIPHTYTAAFLARVLSSLVNYGLNAKVVFKEDAGIASLVKYYILAAAQLAVSATLVLLIERYLLITAPILSTLVKMGIDTVLFFFSFRIQHLWVFRSGKEA